MEIELGNLAFDIDFHPSEQLVASGLITGDLLLYRYGGGSSPEKLLDVKAHDESCRAVRFINDGKAVLTGSPDCSILATDVETGSVVARVENAHEAAVNRLVNLTESTIATGDDDGCIKGVPDYLASSGVALFDWFHHSRYKFLELRNASLFHKYIDVWDTRQRSCCNTFSAHEDFISDMSFVSDSMKLVATSGDGTLSVCNLRSNKVQTRSEFSEDELLSVVIMKNGRKVVCGTQSGTLLLYSWGFFKDCSDRFVDLSPNSVDALLKLDEDRIIAGTENGLISLIGILPNKIIQPIAEHSDHPIERLAFSHDRKFLGSISHDQTLKLWDLDDILLGSGDAPSSQAAIDDSDSDEMDVDANFPASNKGKKTKPSGKGNGASNPNNFFTDL